MLKRTSSFLLSLVIMFTGVLYFKHISIVPVVQAANPGESVTSNGYTYIHEPAYQYYDANDPNQILLYTTANLQNWAASGTSVHLPGTATTRGGIGTSGQSINGNFFFSSGKNNYNNISYGVVKTDTDTLANGTVGTTAEQTFMKNWGLTRMAWFKTSAKDGINVASGTCYYWNLICKFNSAIDLSKMTHLYLDFWISSDYNKSVDGKLNVALWDNAYNSEVDGFEFNIDFAKLRLDGDNPRTGHSYYLDLREFSQTNTQYGTTINLTSIDGVTLRSMSSSSSTQYTSTGKSPTIWIGKMIAMRRTDNLQFWSSYGDTSKDPNQGGMFSLVGYQRYNNDIMVHFPTWLTKKAECAVIGLPVGDRTNTGVDYYYNALDRSCWRWRRADASAASTNQALKAFPNTYLYSTGGGNQSLPLTRNNSKYITAHALGQYTVS